MLAADFEGLESSLAFLDLSRNEIVFVEDNAFANYVDMCSVDLRFNRLGVIGEYSFASSTIRYLRLGYNNISRIETNVLSNVERLTYVDLQFNRLDVTSSSVSSAWIGNASFFNASYA